MPYENGLKDLDEKETEKIRKVALSVNEEIQVPNGKCIHIPTRAIYQTITVRGSLRVMDMCEGCFGVMERAGCIAEIVS